MAATAAEHLDRLDDRFKEIEQATRELTAGLSPEQLLWRPQPGRWGIADCYEHLLVVDGQYLPGLEGAIARAPAAPAGAPYTPGLLARWLVRSLEPGGRLRFPAPKRFRPPSARPNAPDRFLAQREAVRAQLEAARAVDLQGARMASPASSLLRLTIGEALALMAAHDARHVEQARRVREAPGFPAS